MRSMHDATLPVVSPGRRRLLAIALAASAPLQGGAARAQPASRRVGVLAPSTASREEVTLAPFFDEMGQLGWIEKRTVLYDRVYADDQQQLLPKLAAQLVARRPDVIYAPPTPAAIAAKQATGVIPIVFGAVWDPVGSGLVKRLASPGGNVTGVCVFAESLAPKRLELLREIFPHLRRLGWLGDATDPTTRFDRRTLEPIAAAFGVQVVVVEAVNPADVDAAVARLIAEHVDVIYTGTSPLLYNVRGRIIELANRQRLPVAAYRAQLAEAGALFTYGGSLADQIRRSARFVDKVLRGARPADLPVEQATLFELVVNLKAARALGIEIPQSILLRADRVIQ